MRPEDQDYSYPNVGEDDCAGQVDGGASLMVSHDMRGFYYLRPQNHATWPAQRVAPGRRGRSDGIAAERTSAAAVIRN
ncbi:MAG: hypothetical protein IPM25_03595, partial [Chloracidobacterium sp.]|nr:hypothetical protein [Chloracidobacterium sp.]